MQLCNAPHAHALYFEFGDLTGLCRRSYPFIVCLSILRMQMNIRDDLALALVVSQIKS